MLKRKLFTIITILGILGLGYLTVQQKVESNAVVENFCSVKYQHDVEGYKVCKQLSPNKLIVKLTQEETDKYSNEVPSVSLIPLK